MRILFCKFQVIILNTIEVYSHCDYPLLFTDIWKKCLLIQEDTLMKLFELSWFYKRGNLLRYDRLLISGRKSAYWSSCYCRLNTWWFRCWSLSGNHTWNHRRRRFSCSEAVLKSFPTVRKKKWNKYSRCSLRYHSWDCWNWDHKRIGYSRQYNIFLWYRWYRNWFQISKAHEHVYRYLWRVWYCCGRLW